MVYDFRREEDFFRELDFLRGTLAPFFRASDNPMAIACLADRAPT